MSRHTSLRNLQIITAFDSLSYGLLYRFIPVYIEKLGGSHFTVGIHSVGTLIGELLSPEITKGFTNINGKRYGLVFILCLALVTHLMLVVATSCWFVIMTRVLFCAINQAQTLCLALLLDRERNLRTREKLHMNFNVLSGSGYILGPIISGCLFEKEKGFRYISMGAAFLTLINILLLTTIEPDRSQSNNYDECPSASDDNPPSSSPIYIVKHFKDILSENVEGLRRCEFKKHWDILFLKYSFASSFIIFFSKFGQLLKYNYESMSSVIVGYTTAYINAVMFASIHCVIEAKAFTEFYPLKFVNELAFFLLTIFLFLVCYAPSYELFLILLIPTIFLRTFIMTLWNDLFWERKNEALSKLNTPSGVVAGLTIPLLFGLACNQFAHNAVILFTCMPILLCWVTLRFYSRFLKFDGPTTEGDERDGCRDDKVKFL